jgi:Protein of unknown function (DUF2510)
VAPGWYPDPYGRFELRFCTGFFWTGHVMSRGMYAFDEVSPAPPPMVIPPSPRRPSASAASLEPAGILVLAVVVLVCIVLAGITTFR